MAFTNIVAAPAWRRLNSRGCFYSFRMSLSIHDAHPADGINVGVLTRILRRDLIDEVVAETVPRDKATRVRLLPPRVVVYFVLALCLFADEPYEEVMRKLVNGLTSLRLWTSKWNVPTSSAVSQARTRLGAAPLAALFERVAVPSARPGTVGAWFHGMRVMAIDGTVIDLQDTKENLAGFGKFGTGAKQAPFPQLRLLSLNECGTHATVGAVFESAAAASERALLPKLFMAMEPGMLVLCDRGFYSYELWCEALETGADLLWRIKNDLILPVLEEYPDGSYRSELIPRTMKNAYRRGNLRNIPDEVRIPVRVIEYTIPNRSGDDTDRIRIMTSLMNYEDMPGVELAVLYHERWEIELVYDEIKTHQMSHAKLLRSKTPELVRQEMWALLLTHYAVRTFMSEAADDIGEDPDRLSFMRSLRVIRRQVENQAAFSPSETSDSDG